MNVIRISTYARQRALELLYVHLNVPASMEISPCTASREVTSHMSASCPRLPTDLNIAEQKQFLYAYLCHHT